MDFSQFMVQQGLYIAAGLYVLGTLIKNTPFLPDWVIPWILIACGIVAAGFSMDGGFTMKNIVQGIFAAGAATLTNQTWKQSTKREPGTVYLNNVGYNIPQEGVEEIEEVPDTHALDVVEDPEGYDGAEQTENKESENDDH